MSLFKFRQRKAPRTSGSGIGLPGGSEHYRAFVGPPHYYDLMAAMTFNLLTCCGLRQHHRLLDIGCGSLRIGRLLIPYLDQGGYVGVEPQEWLVRDGLLNELGEDILRVKAPRFVYAAGLGGLTEPLGVDYAVAQSIFTHTSRRQLDQWLQELSVHLSPQGALFATYFTSDQDYLGEDWIYPDCARYRDDTLAALAEAHGFRFSLLDWAHPRRQTWALFARPGFDAALAAPPIGWNRYVAALPPG
jgi:cyclopropane fatty-acyl-phospholipid synthase-like methyltransferase